MIEWDLSFFRNEKAFHDQRDNEPQPTELKNRKINSENTHKMCTSDSPVEKVLYNLRLVDGRMKMLI